MEIKYTQKLTGFENMSNQELIDAFIGSLESEGTKKVYKVELQILDKMLNGKPFKDVSKLDLINYNQCLQTGKETTRQRQHSTVRSFFSWLIWAGVICEQENPSKGTFRRITPKADVASKSLLASDVENLMKVSYYSDPRDHAMIMVLATTGVRLSELINMKWSDMFQALDEKTKQLEWYVKVIAKGNKLREVWLRKDTVASLERLIRGKIDPRRDGYVFTRVFGKTIGKLSPNGARKAVKAIAYKAGIKEEFTPHWFRHTFGTLGCNNGAPLREMQANMGHANIKTTEKYLWSQNTKVAKYYPVSFEAPESQRSNT